jgi:hypothetical protein
MQKTKFILVNNASLRYYLKIDFLFENKSYFVLREKMSRHTGGGGWGRGQKNVTNCLQGVGRDYKV